MKKLLLLCILISCGTIEKAEPQDASLEDVRVTLNELKAEALPLLDENGWLATDCDGMLWNGKFASVLGVSDIHASELAAGRFTRTPSKRCWEDKDKGAKSTWSRDMGIGFILWAWRSNDLSILQAHADYGVANNWKMGEPLADGRVIYTPGIIGLLYSAIFSLGGEDNSNRFWPNIWPSKLIDYEAHLQVLKIALIGEIAESLNEADAMPRQPLNGDLKGSHVDEMLPLTSVSTTMFKRLEEHATREPNNVFFQAVYAKYTGDYSTAINLCASKSVGSYVRCDDNISCKLAELIFSCDFIVRQFG